MDPKKTETASDDDQIVDDSHITEDLDDDSGWTQD